MVDVKICGLTTKQAVTSACNEGASFLGFVFYPPSPRHVSAKKAVSLTSELDTTYKTVAVTVDPSDTELDTLLPVFTPHFLQLHGSESITRIEEIKTRYQIPIIKAVAIRTSDDVAHALSYREHVDMLLLDAKAPTDMLPGGNGLTFDWNLLHGRSFSLPWMLSGGLNADNVAKAVTTTGASMIDVSSSLEKQAGVKDPDLIRTFMEKVRAL